ncbi:hypothetical protein KY284_001250 [Solanum tuberosum]|nr:hypothetical protein KY284_001250 [Solanum tuberosum]
MQKQPAVLRWAATASAILHGANSRKRKQPAAVALLRAGETPVKAASNTGKDNQQQPDINISEQQLREQHLPPLLSFPAKNQREY